MAEDHEFLDKLDIIMLKTIDETHVFNGSPLIAVSVLLHKVCDHDPDKFAEATRLIKLFMADAQKAVTQ